MKNSKLYNLSVEAVLTEQSRIEHWIEILEWNYRRVNEKLSRNKSLDARQMEVSQSLLLDISSRLGKAQKEKVKLSKLLRKFSKNP